MKVTVCIGSACHLKGSRTVVDKLKSLVAENNLSDKVGINGTFCLGKCVEGVCVTVDEVVHSVCADSVEDFFQSEIASKLS
ncbi:MAG: NAD(P)H-dependent oxidoreductase subunit E [Eubacteriales bacterium]|nr:NAD(P)H-dependent oxidoreductase subunit E [Eubacteriales bacterium]